MGKVHASKVIVRMLLLKYISLLLTIISPLHTQFYVYAEENNEATTSDEQTKKETEKQPEVDDGFDYNNTDWGTFYDPKNIFCGDDDCYKILGLDYFELLDKKISDDLLRTVTKRYRKLSRKWHPDKNKSKGAKERFVKISQAYKILSNKEKRREYDYYRDRPDAYFQKYGSSVLYSYAEKSNVWFIVLVLLAAASALPFYAQKQKWKKLADHIVNAAVEDSNSREGGTTESKELRTKALDILAEQENASSEADGNANTTNGESSAAKTKPSKRKVTKAELKEKKKQSQEELRKIVITLVDEIDDFGAGYHKPTYKDILIYKLLFLPVAIFKITTWRIQYVIRRLRKLPYNDEELKVFAKSMVGHVAWEAASEEEQNEWKDMELWKMANYEEWIEDQEVKKLSVGEQKKHARWKKKHGTKLS